MKLFLATLLSTLVIPVTAHADDIPSTVEVDTSGQLPDGISLKDVIGKDDPKASRKVERVVRWNEGSGATVAVFVTQEKSGQKNDMTYTSKSLHVGVFNLQSGKPKKVQTIIEAVQPCELDLTARFIDGSIGLTNLDGDDKGELTFAYVTRCAGDVSPMSMKVLMLEGKDKHALRGESRVDLGDEMVGGEFKADFKKAPSALLEHAKKVWARHVDAKL
jgi:hypothetical protein